MGESWQTAFLSSYLQSLTERSREEKKKTQYGIDWVFYNLGLAEGWTPLRLPFFRGGNDAMSTSKTETEFGIDISFQSEDKKTLYLFVLKDEPLRNKTWSKNDFDGDIRRAASPGLDHPELERTENVYVILGYNKDEDQGGIKLFEDLTKNIGDTIRGSISLKFERWNLTTMVDKVRSNLLDATLLPQKFYSLFAYLCSQFADFRHGSDEWEKQMVPNWRRFLDDLLNDKADERSMFMVPVCLQILEAHAGDNPSAETGIIDLTEWAVVKCWSIAESRSDENLRALANLIWVQVYLAELERFFSKHEEVLKNEYALDLAGGDGYVNAIASSLIAYWHVARFGIMAIGFFEYIPEDSEEQQKAKEEIIQKLADRLIVMLEGNPGTKRPLIDLHHIELFLIWRTLFQARRFRYIGNFLVDLGNRLLVRRFGQAGVPFIEARNNLELVFEYAAEGKKPPEFSERSSYLVQMLLELTCAVPQEMREDIFMSFYRQIVMGQDSGGRDVKEAKDRLDLMSWEPPRDWLDQLRNWTLAYKGATQCVGFFNSENGIEEQIRGFVDDSRGVSDFQLGAGIPISLMSLLCLKQRCPIPPEFWRMSVFGDKEASAENEEGLADKEPEGS